MAKIFLKSTGERITCGIYFLKFWGFFYKIACTLVMPQQLLLLPTPVSVITKFLVWKVYSSIKMSISI